MKYYLVAGEASGDLHGSNLVRALKEQNPDAQFRCWGGDLMEQAGAQLVKHYRELAFMGFAEVLANIGTILKNFKQCKKDILQYRPDAVILIDYPGFNLRMAKWAKLNGFTTIYYISPQVWAWKENRVHIIKRYVDQMLVILPFEKEFYAKWNYPVDYVGHPLASLIEKEKQEKKTLPVNSNRPIVALLPGSRKQEILKKLPVMLQVSRHFPEYQFVVARAPGQEDSFYKTLLDAYPDVTSVGGATYTLLANSYAALVTSGTATLETALFGVPEVVCYKGGNISYQIAKRLIRIKYISLVNLVMDKEVVRELIQDDMNEPMLTKALQDILSGEIRSRIFSDYEALRQKLSKGGDASANAAGLITRFLLTKQGADEHHQ
jgi:lipid-A-disaccharide synthase